MKLAIQLAYRNLIGAGLRTWLSVFVLSFSYVIIIFYNGFIDGWNAQAKNETIAYEYGQGQLRHSDYDPYDPFSLKDAHAHLSGFEDKDLAPVLIVQANAYPHDRMVPTLLKGLNNRKNILELPIESLATSEHNFPIVIGSKMAESLNVKEGDEFLIRWRDKNGTFDAEMVRVEFIFDIAVPSIDNGTVWMDYEKLQTITGLENQATYYVAGKNFVPGEYPNWEFYSQSKLSENLDAIISSKKISGSIMYIFLLGIALLAIFDTQVFSIFRRQKEIGTYIALGMTRKQVVTLFTVEGAMNAIFAIVMAAIYGIPLLWWLSSVGIAMPEASTDTGVPVAETIFPVYGIGLVLGTIIIVFIAAAIVSYLPSRKIAQLDPVDAIKGKVQ